MQYAVFSLFLKVTTPSESAVLSTEGSSSDQKEKNSLGALIYLFYQKKLNFCLTIETLIYPGLHTCYQSGYYSARTTIHFDSVLNK